MVNNRSLSLFIRIFIILLLVSTIKPVSATAAVNPKTEQQPDQYPAEPATKERGFDRLNEDPALFSMLFVPNRGQIKDSDVKFQAFHQNGVILFKPGELDFVIDDRTSAERNKEKLNADSEDEPNPKPPYEIKVRYQQFNRDAQIVGTDPLPSVMNFFSGSDSADWQTNVETYGGIAYQDFYPGVQMTISSQAGKTKTTFVIAPNADLSPIQWEYQGVKDVSTDQDGNLLVSVESEDSPKIIKESAPIAWQTINGEQVAVPVAFAIDNKKVSFSLPQGYNPEYELVIDPTIEWGSWVGNVDFSPSAIARDSAGNIVVAGMSMFCNGFSFYPDILVQKINAAGDSLISSTCLSSTASDVVVGLAVDADDNIILSGYKGASTNFPIVGGISTSQGEDVLVVKLAPDGASILYSTLVGGSSSDRGNRTVVDATGKIYVTGYSQSSNFLTTPNAYRTTLVSGRDTVVVQIDPTLTGTASILYSSLLGGNGTDIGNEIAVGPEGKVYVAGNTTSSGFPLAHPTQPTFGGYSQNDAFLTVLDLSISGTGALLFSTYLGGSQADSAVGLALDEAGNAYLSGQTRSTNFPVTANAFQSTLKAGSNDLYLTKIDPFTYQVVYSSYFGGSANDSLGNMVMGANGLLYLAGSTLSHDFPLNAALQGPGADSCIFETCHDAFVSVLDLSNNTLELSFSTYLAGSDEDFAYGVTTDATGNIFVTGDSDSEDFPATTRLSLLSTSFVLKIAYQTQTQMPALAWSVESDQNFAFFGWSVSAAGSLNGDDYVDLIVGAPYYGDHGAVWIYYGPINDQKTAPDVVLTGSPSADRFGWSVSTAGDVNGDTYEDVIVSALGCSQPQSNEGCVYVYHGSANGLETSPAWTTEGNQSHAAFGYVVGSVGDVNGDGVGDVFIGAPNYSNGQSNEGKVEIYFGSHNDGLSATPNWVKEGDQPYAYFGLAVNSAGDVNGDGRSDLLVGAPNARSSSDQPGAGKAFVFMSTANNQLSTTADWIVEGDQAEAHLGEAVSSAGEINGDGKSDVMVGAPDYDGTLTDEGKVFVFFSSTTGLNTTPDWTSAGDQENASYGVSVALAGDVDGNGYADLLVGANRFSNGEANEGKVYLYYVTGSEVAATPGWTEEGNQAFTSFGYSVGPAGDVDQDGKEEFFICAPQWDHDSNLLDAGLVRLYH